MANKADKIKEYHRQRIKDYFFREYSGSKKDVSQATGISPTTCLTIIQELLEEKYLLQGENREATGGRPEKCYELNSNYACYCLIWINRNPVGATNSVRVLNHKREIIYQEDISLNNWRLEDFLKLLDAIMAVIPVNVISISIPGVIDGRKVITCDVDELAGCALVDILEEKYNITVVMENDVNLAVIGQHRGENSIAFLYQVECAGAGCGIMINHQLYRGKSIFAGEVCNLKGCKLSREGYDHRYDNGPANREIADREMEFFLNAIVVMWNPEKIAICSKFGQTKEELQEYLDKTFMKVHHPDLEILSSIQEPLFKGLMEIAYDSQRNHIQLSEFNRF